MSTAIIIFFMAATTASFAGIAITYVGALYGKGSLWTSALWAVLTLLSIIMTVALVQGADTPKTTISATSTLPVAHTWTKTDSLAYANDQLQAQANKQFACLKTLWYNESKWNPKAFNKIKVMGKNAGGIPQLLGLSPLTPPTEQIDRGLSYIVFRYTLPCNALKHYKKVRWY